MVLLGAGSVGGTFYYYTRDLPTLEALLAYKPLQVVRVLDREGEVLGEIGQEKRTVVAFDQIPKMLVNAVIAAEDATFYQNRGVDPIGVVRAFIENVVLGRRAPGRSTITQQVVKRLLLSPERTVKRKVQEIVLAYRLSDKLTKDQILELYLNQIYYGHGRYGCEEAARFYFGKSVTEVDAAEAALLAGLPQSPERLSPLKHPDAAKTRQRYVLTRMAELRFLELEQAAELARQPIKIVKGERADALAPEAVGLAYREALRWKGPDELTAAGTVIKTTIDANVQTAARQALEEGLEALDARQGYRGALGHFEGKKLDAKKRDLARARKGKVPATSEIVEALVTEVRHDPKKPEEARLIVDMGGLKGEVNLSGEPRYAKGKPPLVERFEAGDLVRVRARIEPDPDLQGPTPMQLELGPQAAMVVLDPSTGQILALVGGYHFEAASFDRAQRAARQPGSAFKPFVYAAAIDKGQFTAASIVNDAPDVYDLWKPQNHEKETFRGPVRLRTALAHSINTVAIKLLSEIGLPDLKRVAFSCGIAAEIDDQQGLALALGTLSVTPLELAGAFMPFFNGGRRIRPHAVVSIAGKEEDAPPSEPALRPETAYVVLSMMSSVVKEGTARGALKLGRPVAGKTGTSNGARDAWFVGGTPDLLAAVWVGFDDMAPLGRGESGGKAALGIWLPFMEKALAGRPVKDFVQPPGVEVQTIDARTGLLAAPGGEGIEEVFLPGTAPRETAEFSGAGTTSPDEMLLR